MTHCVVVVVETQGSLTTRQLIEEIASNLQSVNEFALKPGLNVVSSAQLEDVRPILKQTQQMVTW